VHDALIANDRPLGYWPLSDAGSSLDGQLAQDLSQSRHPARLVGTRVDTTPGPLGAPAARFDGRGRFATTVTTAALGAFTMEFFFRADSCTRSWTQVAGTAVFDSRGRQGVNLLHYPAFWPTGCHLAAEFWRNDRYQGGCGTHSSVQTGVWLHFALTYDGRTARCYVDGRQASAGLITPGYAPPAAPFGIGGAGSGYGGPLDSGSLSSVAVYGRALTAAQVRRHAGAG
jgi:hypothetical protein